MLVYHLCDHGERYASSASVHETVHEQAPDITYNRRWGGWGSNPRPTDYEKYGSVHCTHYLHGYHEGVPPMALIALFASMARSTNRSTPSMVSPDASYRTLPPPGQSARAPRPSA